ncbi:tetratricopeptide repeat (TPR)-like superfamily protein [Artemisia annua]|uniref:Tetratricopeptide repeat (TPR)-like superfamily protein n=1 Tax=Artemisia annua TaxID=35608 RepID=A0A2U1KHE6_ARTAN|nr:tetratricopeptide repeat (TPR)-like superfamily protein [Artemisia annua]
MLRFVINIGYFESDVCVGCALIDLFTKRFGDLESAKKVFDQMPERNSQLHSWVVKMGLYLDVYVGCSLLDMYSKCDSRESIEDAGKVFERMLDHNVTIWTAMITRYVQSGVKDDAELSTLVKTLPPLRLLKVLEFLKGLNKIGPNKYPRKSKRDNG